jgi:hypothetical protein
LLPPPPREARIPLPGGGVLSTLPGQGDLLALTMDDGVNSDVVRMYLSRRESASHTGHFCITKNIRLLFGAPSAVCQILGI